MHTTRNKITLPVIGLIALGASGAALASNMSAPNPADAKITMQDALTKATALVPGGQVRQGELETEHGGSGLRYSFDIRTAQGNHEVGIDAMTGAVLENGLEKGGHEHEADGEQAD